MDKGKAETIALAVSVPNSLLILDDLKARKHGKDLKLNYTGTLGVIVKAKELGVILNIRPILDKLSETNFRISPKIVTEILKYCDEL